MAYTDREDVNYLGRLYLVGAYQTPFLRMLGGLSGGNAATSRSFQFPVAQPWNLSSASQNTQSEATAAAEGTPTTYTRGQDYNVCQIMKYDYEVSAAKQSTTGEFSGIQVIGDQPVMNELTFQRSGAMLQMALDLEYSCFQGTFVDVSGASTNQTTRGLLEAISTNEVAAATGDLTKARIDTLLRTMAGNGAVFNNMVCFANAFQMQQISDIYGYAPTDRIVGGVAIKQVLTDFCTFGVVYEPQTPTDDITFIDMSVCRLVFVPSYGNQMVADVEKAEVAAKTGGFLYTQVGLDYGPEEYHGKITNLSTS